MRRVVGKVFAATGLLAQTQDESPYRLHLRLLNATGLASHRDTFCKIVVADIKRKSRVLDKGAEAAWNEDFEIGVFYCDETPIVIEVLTHGHLHNRHSLGKATLTVEQVPRDSPGSFDLPLDTEGTLHIEAWTSGEPFTRRS